MKQRHIKRDYRRHFGKTKALKIEISVQFHHNRRFKRRFIKIINKIFREHKGEVKGYNFQEWCKMLYGDKKGTKIAES